MKVAKIAAAPMLRQALAQLRARKAADGQDRDRHADIVRHLAGRDEAGDQCQQQDVDRQRHDADAGPRDLAAGGREGWGGRLVGVAPRRVGRRGRIHGVLLFLGPGPGIPGR
jgi:hypothetical protein